MIYENTPLVSVIIPVYKVEKYLDECVQSVLRQTYINLEIILVDDGSPDNCGKMCDVYALTDHRIKVIHKDNGGLSDARNAGMQIASGDYFNFVDSDDYIHSRAIELMVEEAIRSNADLVCADHQSFVDGNAVCPETVHQQETLHFANVSAMERFSRNDWGAWGKLYKRNVHDGILFPKGKIHEDEAIMFQILERCKRISLLSDKLYLYRQRPGSITDQRYTIQKMDWFEAWISNIAFVKERYPTVLKQCISKAWTVALYNIEHIVGDQSYFQEIQSITAFSKEYARDILFNKYISLTRKMRLVLLLMSDMTKQNCLYARFYTIVDKVRGRR